MSRLKVTMKDQERLIRWAEPRIGIPEGYAPQETICMSVIDTATEEIVAVIAFNAFYSNQASLHLASNGRKSWLSRGVLRAVFGYAFAFRGWHRLNFLVSHKNIPVQVLALKMGLRVEGVARCGAEDGTDAILFGMLARECRWIDAIRGSNDHG
jgi:RimJ/RimL family protein N-acetyltransferase